MTHISKQQKRQPNKTEATSDNEHARVLHSDLNDQNLFHSTIDLPGVLKNLNDQTEVHSGDLER